MKQLFTSIVFIYLCSTLFSQAPQAFKFQTIIRNTSGEALPLQDITLKFLIHIYEPGGEVVYSEQHIETTNTSGLISVDIGLGEVLSGSFADIIWGSGEYFLEELIDIGSIGEFQVFGTVQLMSVPYALHSTSTDGIQSMTTEQRDAIENPHVGMQIYNTSTNCINYFGGVSWFETCGECTPMPSQANAGADQYIDDETLSINLEGNSPEIGIGAWSIATGIGGTFEDINDPTTLFTGEDCTPYSLKWAVSNPCGTTEDFVNIEFEAQPTPAYAGEDQLFLDNTTTTTLEANTPLVGEGIWNIANGLGGSFSDPNNPNAIFTGQLCESYILHWTISTLCNSSPDQVEIQFNAIPTTAYAGGDQLYLEGTWTTLEANEPIIGEGLWTILEGEGGQVTSPNDPTSIFLGQINGQYILEWQISTACDTTNDEVNIGFGILPISCGFTINCQTNKTATPPLSAVQPNQDVEYTSSPLKVPQANQNVESTSSLLKESEPNKNVKASSPLSVSQTNQDVKATGGITSFTLSSSTSWAVTENASWLSVEPTNGRSIDTTLTVTYEVNTSAEPRIGQIAITANGGTSAVNVSVSQAGISKKRGLSCALLWICGIPIRDLRDSSVYSTVQIGNQCWMAKNLNIGTLIDGNIGQKDNSTIEKYCYDNNEVYCNTYGGLYQWDEMMQYVTTEGTQGVCPEGWHLPTDAEWCTLELEVDPTTICRKSGGRGTDGGTTLKQGGGSNFKARLAGYRVTNGLFFNYLGTSAHYWTSSKNDSQSAWDRELNVNMTSVDSYNSGKDFGFSVRCIKDN